MLETQGQIFEDAMWLDMPTFSSYLIKNLLCLLCQSQNVRGRTIVPETHKVNRPAHKAQVHGHKHTYTPTSKINSAVI